MNSNETIAQMFIRFDTITMTFMLLGKRYILTELMNKILRSLPKAYQSKMMAIQEARDLSKLPLEEFIGSF